MGAVAGDGSGVAELAAVVLGEVHAQGGAEAVGVNGDADQAFLWPEAQGVPDEAGGEGPECNLGNRRRGGNFSWTQCFGLPMQKFSVRGRRGSALVARRARPAIMGHIRMTSSDGTSACPSVPVDQAA